jgi:hypothetical protein
MKKVLIAALLIWSLILFAPVRADNPHGPSVVASGGGASQTASIAQTTLWTPAADGFYAVFAYAAIRSGSCSWTDNLYWTDTTGSNHTYNIGAGQGPVPQISIYDTANSGIKFQVSLSGSCTYDYFIIVVKE